MNQDEACAIAFCADTGPEIFHGVVHAKEIWRPDPFDVVTIHNEARDMFQRLVTRVTAPDHTAGGRMLLLKGEAGAGKTHLMRALRAMLHEKQSGYMGYVQFTSATTNPARYILRHLVDSLEQPYAPGTDDRPGLQRLSDALVSLSSVMSLRHQDGPQALTALREEVTPRQLPKLVNFLAEHVAREPRFARVDMDFVRALLLLQGDAPLVRGAVIKYLRCDDLNANDSHRLGGLSSHAEEDGAAWMLEQIGRAITATNGGALVFAVDQIEDVFKSDDPNTLNTIMGRLRSLIDMTPNTLVVVACLETLYESMRQHLDMAVRDRLEMDPQPIRLEGLRKADEVRALLIKRMAWFYEQAGCADGETLFPFDDRDVAILAGKRSRDVLDWCRQYQERCFHAAGLVEKVNYLGNSPPAVDSSPPATQGGELSTLWDTFSLDASLPGEPDATLLTSDLARALSAATEEDEKLRGLQAIVDAKVNQIQAKSKSHGELHIGVCNQDARGGGLAKAIDSLLHRAGESRSVIVRTGPFPDNPNTAIHKLLEKCRAKGTIFLVLSAHDIRAIQAFPFFRKEHGQRPDWEAWRRESKPMASLESIVTLINALSQKPAASTPPSTQPSTSTQPTPSTPSTVSTASTPSTVSTVSTAPPPPDLSRPIRLGIQMSEYGGEVLLQPEDLTRHTAFLGNTGSGKTTLAMAMIEELALRGVPAILVDRKGDLCRYAGDEAWASHADLDTKRRLSVLRDRIEAIIYTPGDARGHDLPLPLLPPDIHTADPVERDRLCDLTAGSLGAILGYGSKGADPARLAVLRKALAILAAEARTPIRLAGLISFVAERDERLLNQIGHLDSKNLDRLLQDLESMRINRERLMCGAGDMLDIERMLQSQASGKTRICIISTKFLGGAPELHFWMSRFLVEVERWASRHPSPSLQAVILFDEADIYLPASSRPPSKQPMENLLRRARSAGLGILLATQSPGDLDYRCRDQIQTWFLGCIREEVALRKLEPLFTTCGVDAARILPSRQIGQFMMLKGGKATSLNATTSLVLPEQLPEDSILELARNAVLT